MANNSVYKARMLGYPEITSLQDLASQLRLPVEVVGGYVKRSWTSGYKTFRLPKKPTGFREIHAPVRELKFIQVWILRNILSHLRSSRSSTAFERGNDIGKNAARHIGQNYIVNVDVKDFFPSIGANKVSQLFQSLGYSREIAWILTNLVTFKGRLPQGSPASPKLANLICHRLDARIDGFCQKKNMSYTRYADDITVSTSNRSHLRGTLRFLDHVVSDEGFVLRREKTEIFGSRRAKVVTGLVVSDEVRVGRAKYRQLRSKMYQSLRDNDLAGLAYIDGYLNFVMSVDPKTYAKLRQYFSHLKTVFTSSTHGPTVAAA